MSGIVGHTMYAILGSKVAEQRKLPIATLLQRHWSSYLAGAYLGCDIQTLPAAVCLDTGTPVGYGGIPIEKSPLTGGPIRPWTLDFQGQSYTPRDIHRLFYGRAHLVFGFSVEDRQHTVPWDHLPDYLAATVEDAFLLYPPGHRRLAYLFGWMAHIVGDSLIKSVRPGIDLDLLDGKYTPTNRPIQDLVSFHEIGRRELGIDWAALLNDVAATPVEPVQLHYMRATRPRGLLAEQFSNAWVPGHEALLRRVLEENRQFQQVRNQWLLKQYRLTETAAGWQCDAELSRQAGGLSYTEMVELAKRANFRHALWQMGEAVADLFAQVVDRVARLAELSAQPDPAWDELGRRWKQS